MILLYCKLILLFFCGVIRILYLILNNKFFIVGGLWWGFVKRGMWNFGEGIIYNCKVFKFMDSDGNN